MLFRYLIKDTLSSWSFFVLKLCILKTEAKNSRIYTCLPITKIHLLMFCCIFCIHLSIYLFIQFFYPISLTSPCISRKRISTQQCHNYSEKIVSKNLIRTHIQICHLSPEYHFHLVCSNQYTVKVLVFSSVSEASHTLFQ